MHIFANSERRRLGAQIKLLAQRGFDAGLALFGMFYHLHVSLFALHDGSADACLSAIHREAMRFSDMYLP